jgi:predicted SprT family Zn-dependent metalloprotease
VVPRHAQDAVTHPYYESLNCPTCDGPAVFDRQTRRAVVYRCGTCQSEIAITPKKAALAPTE